MKTNAMASLRSGASLANQSASGGSSRVDGKGQGAAVFRGKLGDQGMGGGHAARCPDGHKHPLRNELGEALGL